MTEWVSETGRAWSFSTIDFVLSWHVRDSIVA